MDSSFLSVKSLIEEMNRCESCLEAPCEQACPVACSPKDFIMAARGGSDSDFARSAAMILKQNPLGMICGAVCPEQFCVRACSRNKTNNPIDIPSVQFGIMEQAKGMNFESWFRRKEKTKYSFAVVGGGPAGLAAAGVLAAEGHSVTIFEKHKQPGGMARLIPQGRLPKSAVTQDLDFIRYLGVEIVTGTKVKDIRQLRLSFDGVIVSTGRWNNRLWEGKGEDFSVAALEFLGRGSISAHSVAIIGGGGIAVDCARKAIDCGVKRIEIFALESLAELPLNEDEYRYLRQSKIGLNLRQQIVSMARRGERFDLVVRHVELADGKPFAPANVEPIEESRYSPGGFDFVVCAIGNAAEIEDYGDRNILLAGEAAIGPATVVEAVASGKEVAHSLLRQVNMDEMGNKSESQWQAMALSNYLSNPVDLSTTVFGIPLENPFILSASPMTDGYERSKQAYQAGWAGVILKTTFDGFPVKTPSEYMHLADALSYANCDSVSARALDEACRDVSRLRAEFPNKLTMASTGTVMSGVDEVDRPRWTEITKKLEMAGAMCIEYSLSCPGTDGVDEPAINQNVAKTTQVVEWILSEGDPTVPKLFKLTALVPSVIPFVDAIKSMKAKFPSALFGITIGDTLPNLVFQPRGKKRWEDGIMMGMGGQRIWGMNALAVSVAVNRGISINASGGIMSYKDAAHYLAMGADFVQLCSFAMRYGKDAIEELKNGVASMMIERKISSMSRLKGMAAPDIVLPFDLLSDTLQIPAVDTSKCASCGNCLNCPAQAVSLDGRGFPVFDEALCVGCSFCSHICFTGALKMTPRHIVNGARR